MKKQRNFTIAEVRDLAKMGRMMDSGESPHVKDEDGNRRAVLSEVMSELELVSGQTASPAVITAILEAHLSSIRARIALDRIVSNEQ